MANVGMFTYDPALVSVNVGANLIKGFTDGSFVVAERNNDSFALKMGVDGIGTRAKSNDKSGKITITLQQTSPSCDVISAIGVADELTNGGVVPVSVRDTSGRTVAFAATAWLVKPPNAEFGKETMDRVFVFMTDNLQLFSGGN